MGSYILYHIMNGVTEYLKLVKCHKCSDLRSASVLLMVMNYPKIALHQVCGLRFIINHPGITVVAIY